MARKEFKEVLLNTLDEVLKEDKEVLKLNKDLINNLIDNMTDAELDNLVDEMEAGNVVLPYVIPNNSKITYEHVLQVALKLGVKTHERVTKVENGIPTMSKIPNLILELATKKQSQTLEKKRSIKKDQNSRNELTGQLTNNSKSMPLSGTEATLMLANGQYESIKEYTKYRGGDEGARIALEKLAELGLPITQANLEKYSTGPEVNNTVKQYLLGMYIDSEIGQLKNK